MFSFFKVKERSMEPFCKEGDFVVMQRMSYLFSSPQIGHIVVLRHPFRSSFLLLKRIVGVKQGEKGKVYWVEGDNTSKSRDSRHFGWVGRRDIVGKTIIKVGNPHYSKMSMGTPTLLLKSGGGVIHKTGSFGYSIMTQRVKGRTNFV